jgi:Cu-Zn family superoxide dismutase
MATPPFTKNGLLVLALLAGAATVAGCGNIDLWGGGPKATAKLEPTKGNTASGVVTFKDEGEQTILVAKIQGLKPNQEHGFHLHAKGDCSSGDGLSAGGHFNPTNQSHGSLHKEHHAGDLPPLKSDASGRAELRVVLEGVSVLPGTTSVVGLGLIVHAAPDDFTTQPTGNSGARIACGVVVKK